MVCTKLQYLNIVRMLKRYKDQDWYVLLKVNIVMAVSNLEVSKILFALMFNASKLYWVIINEDWKKGNMVNF